MPKKFGSNSKKDEARERETQKKKEKREEEVTKAEDSHWRETDEKVLKKLDNEKEKERKKQETLQRKQENKELVEKEMEELMKSKQEVQKGPTRRDIEIHKERTLQKLLEKNQQEKENVIEIEEIDTEKEFVNTNYQNNVVNENGVEVINITGVNQALEELELVDFDKHPEKRMRAAWNSFFEKQLPMYKIAYPSLKRQQLIHLMQKEFKKSPENPVFKKQTQIAKESQK